MIFAHQSLKGYNTFGFDVTARYFAQPASIKEAMEAITEAHRLGAPLYVLGRGSNVLFTQDFDGLIIKPALLGIEVVEQAADHVVVAAGAGEVWDHLVAWCVDRNWGGLENLSHIPGTVGAAPAQNIGAYGAEAKDTIVKVEGLFIDTLKPFVFSAAECAFGYRNSIFKTELKNRVLITKVFFKLSTAALPNTDYGRIEEELQSQPDRSIRCIRQAIINIRNQKLPDPAKMGNAGSFFKNPTVTEVLALKIQATYPNMPLYPADLPGYGKLPAAFLIEKSGWKGVRKGNVGVHDTQPLVLVAFEGAKGSEILDLSMQIQRSVKEKFDILLEPEVNIL